MQHSHDGRTSYEGKHHSVATESLLSPSLQHAHGSTAHAFEMKFLLTEAVAQAVQAWAVEHLRVDAHADPQRGNSYQTTTLYFDTVNLDLFHRARGFRGRKYRLRRYGQEPTVYLERKLRRGDRVQKHRTSVPQHEIRRISTENRQDQGQTQQNSELADCGSMGQVILTPPILNSAVPDPLLGTHPDWPGEWFRAKVVQRGLRPTCCLTYERSAFVALGAAGPLRLTLDRRIRGAVANGWEVSPVVLGHEVLTGEVICEFKFRDAMPSLFKQVIADLNLQPASVSKYRRLMQAIHLVRELQPYLPASPPNSSQ